MFKQLQQESQQLNQILTRAGGVPASNSYDDSAKYLGGFTYGGLGQRSAALAFDKTSTSGAAPTTGRSIDQLFQNLKQKADQANMRLDQTTENESKAFFASKNVDIASLEYSLKAAQMSFSQFKNK